MNRVWGLSATGGGDPLGRRIQNEGGSGCSLQNMHEMNISCFTRRAGSDAEGFRWQRAAK